MDKLCVTLNLISEVQHTSMIVTGFLLLQRQGKINLEIKRINPPSSDYPHMCLVEAQIRGKGRIGYDLLDGYNLDRERTDAYLETVDFYFKRSFSEEENAKFKNGHKICPLGMNYRVTCKGNPLDKSKNISGFAKNAVKTLLGRNNSRFDVKSFEQIPANRIGADPKILFYTRLWSPAGEPGEALLSPQESEERDTINSMRLAILDELSHAFGKNFSGGLAATAYAREYSPHWVLGESSTNRASYLERVKRHDICIGSMGLHQSTGWKTAEYVAASRAIILEKPAYSATGGFSDGKNYLSYATAAECFEKTRYLAEHPEVLLAMQWENYRYYQEYLRPDMQILHSILTALQ